MPRPPETTGSRVSNGAEVTAEPRGVLVSARWGLSKAQGFRGRGDLRILGSDGNQGPEAFHSVWFSPGGAAL